jgi:ATP-dependent RNA helicase DeaD
MLNMGFQEDVEFVMSHLPSERVTALFSATTPEPIIELAHTYMRDPEVIRLSKPQALTVPEVDQLYYEVPFQRKLDALCRVLDAMRPDRTIVFCATKRMVDDHVDGLHGHGYSAEGLHGDMSQAAREKVLRAFRTGRTELLVATDVAARGLDVPEVSHVVNFDIPPDPEYYVHRIGRTARFGRSGHAITFVNPREISQLKAIERLIGVRIRREQVPTAADVEAREAEALEERLLQALENGRWGRYRALVEELADEHDPVDLAAAALALAAGRPSSGRPRTVMPDFAPITPEPARREPAPTPNRRPPSPRSRAPQKPGPSRPRGPAPNQPKGGRPDGARPSTPGSKRPTTPPRSRPPTSDRPRRPRQ